MYLSILVPIYNEEHRLMRALKELVTVQFPCDTEIVVVDDGSRDHSWELLQPFADEGRVRLLRHHRNRGKGAAIRTAARAAAGEYIVVYDADLEYEASDLPKLLRPVLDGKAEVVYGSRSFGSHSAYSFWYVMGNRGITLAANVLYNTYISDLETCYKLLPRRMYLDLKVTSRGFGMEAELTAKILKSGVRPFEVPISYKARTREEGKKISWRDGVGALWILGRERVRRKVPSSRRHRTSVR
ncbi:glycosyltransferase family 2 protein [Salininema proteolyticum]|uniref:Glycosyltransferase family 2 protein n=1 Tax=Salininema proteolyticum TaxID=1607685 RepID=A0ABV8TU53_9ACTN